MSVIYARSHSSFLYSVTYNSTQKNYVALCYREMLNRCLKKGLKDIDSWSGRRRTLEQHKDNRSLLFIDVFMVCHIVVASISFLFIYFGWENK
jgi:hypothetical protein